MLLLCLHRAIMLLLICHAIMLMIANITADTTNGPADNKDKTHKRARVSITVGHIYAPIHAHLHTQPPTRSHPALPI